MSILVTNGGNKMINTKRTKIVCTIGPATNDVEILKRFGNHRLDVTIGSALDIFGGSIPFEVLAEMK